MCVYIYIYIYTYIHTYTSVYIYIYIYIHLSISLSLYLYSIYLFRAVVPGAAYERPLTTYGHFRTKDFRAHDSRVSVFVLKSIPTS